MCNKKVTRSTLTIATIAAMLLAATAASLTSSQIAIAYSRNQAAAQTNDCGNGSFPTNIGCQNTACQIQGDENSCALASRQSFPAAEEPVPPTPEECAVCFDTLNLEQLQALAVEIEDQFDIDFPDTSSRAAIIATICEALIEGPPGGLTVGNVNAAMAQVDIITIDERQEVRDCLLDIF